MSNINKVIEELKKEVNGLGISDGEWRGFVKRADSIKKRYSYNIEEKADELIRSARNTIGEVVIDDMMFDEAVVNIAMRDAREYYGDKELAEFIRKKF